MLRPRRRAQTGLSLVELMVGIAVGLFIVAGASLVVTTQLGANRRLLLETKMQQDLRAAMDIITRELRRAGSHNLPQEMVWYPGQTTVSPNTYVDVSLTGTDHIEFRYWRESGITGPFGFKLDDGRIRSLIGGTWQELTDASVMTVTNFNIAEETVLQEQLPCPRMCVDGTDACWPVLTVRDYVVDITATAIGDASVQRSLRNRVRVRNDWLQFNDPDPTPPAMVCPP